MQHELNSWVVGLGFSHTISQPDLDKRHEQVREVVAAGKIMPASFTPAEACSFGSEASILFK